MIVGLVLAAGASTRMGTPKASLPLAGGHTVLSKGVASLLAAGLPRVIVVVGAHAETVVGALRTRDRRVEVVVHPRWADGQLSSMLAGLAVAEQAEAVLEAVLVTLVDVPLVSPATTRAVIAAWRASRASLVRPARGVEHGHPVLFDRAILDEVRRADPAVGLKAVIRAHEADIVNVEVSDEGAFADLDTPADYARLVGALGSGHEN